MSRAGTPAGTAEPMTSEDYRSRSNAFTVARSDDGCRSAASEHEIRSSSGGSTSGFALRSVSRVAMAALPEPIYMHTTDTALPPYPDAGRD